MRWRYWIALSTILVVMAALYGPAPAGRVLASHAPHVQSPYHKRVCKAPAHGHAECTAHVVTDQQGNPLVTNPSPAAGAYGPAQFHTGYNLPCTPGGTTGTICSSASYGGEIIAIVDAYHDPTIASDLNAYSSTYGIPSCPQGALSDSTACLTIVDQNGGTNLPTTVDSGWSLEEALDVETAHQICQTCKILMIEASSSGYSDLATAVNTAASLGATEISNSYGSAEFSTESSYDSAYTHPGIAVTVSSGDTGNAIQYPAASPGVVSVGGTTLNLNGDNTYSSESVWSSGGSGCSGYESANSWQTSVSTWSQTGCGAKRGVADVSADANPSTGAAVYDTTAYNSQTGWFTVGGTSLASPLIAATFALAGGVAAGGSAQQVVYAKFNSTNSHDVTSGSNGTCGTIMCNATVGYDGPTGLGSPNGLAGFGASTTTTTPTNTPTSTDTPSPTPTTGCSAPPTATPPTDTIAADSFDRSCTNSWGTADVGGAWSTSGSAYAVTAGLGTIQVDANAEPNFLPAVSAQDVNLVARMVPPAPNNSATTDAGIGVRYLASSGSYYLLSAYTTSSQVVLELRRKPDNTQIIPDLATSLIPGQPFWLRLQATGINPTTLSYKIWPDGTSEPGSWTGTATDSTPALQGAGGIGLIGYVDTGTASYGFGNLSATAPVSATPTPTNTPPPTDTPSPTTPPTSTPTSTPTPTDTPVPTPTSTPTPTSAPTDTPTDTPLPTATPTDTAVPTPTNTPTSTPPATATPTATPTGPPTLLSDDFEADALGSVPTGWTVVGGSWTVQQGSGSDTTQVVSQTNATNTGVMELVAGSSSWTNYTVQADVQPSSSPNSITITARRQDANNNYQFLLKNGNQWYLGGRQNGTWFTLAYGSYPYTAGSWYTLKLSVTGTTISGSINGTTVATATDSTFSSGGVSLRTTTAPSYDNVLVTSS